MAGDWRRSVRRSLSPLGACQHDTACRDCVRRGGARVSPPPPALRHPRGSRARVRHRWYLSAPLDGPAGRAATVAPSLAHQRRPTRAAATVVTRVRTPQPLSPPAPLPHAPIALCGRMVCRWHAEGTCQWRGHPATSSHCGVRMGADDTNRVRVCPQLALEHVSFNRASGIDSRISAKN